MLRKEENNVIKCFRMVMNILLSRIVWLLVASVTLEANGEKQNKTLQKQKELLNECGFSKLKARRTKSIRNFQRGIIISPFWSRDFKVTDPQIGSQKAFASNAIASTFFAILTIEKVAKKSVLIERYSNI